MAGMSGTNAPSIDIGWGYSVDLHEGGGEIVVGIGGGCGYSFGDYVLAPVKLTGAIEASTISLR